MIVVEKSCDPGRKVMGVMQMFLMLAKLTDGFCVCLVSDRVLSEAFEGLLPRDNPKNTRFAINFFTSIGLGGLT